MKGALESGLSVELVLNVLHKLKELTVIDKAEGQSLAEGDGALVKAVSHLSFELSWAKISAIGRTGICEMPIVLALLRGEVSMKLGDPRVIDDDVIVGRATDGDHVGEEGIALLPDKEDRGVLRVDVLLRRIEGANGGEKARLGSRLRDEALLDQKGPRVVSVELSGVDALALYREVLKGDDVWVGGELGTDEVEGEVAVLAGAFVGEIFGAFCGVRLRKWKRGGGEGVVELWIIVRWGHRLVHFLTILTLVLAQMNQALQRKMRKTKGSKVLDEDALGGAENPGKRGK